MTIIGPTTIQIFLIGVFVLLPGTAHAYLDAGTGGVFLQAIILALASGIVTLKLFWRRLKAMVMALLRRPGTDEGSYDGSS